MVINAAWAAWCSVCTLCGILRISSSRLSAKEISLAGLICKKSPAISFNIHNNPLSTIILFTFLLVLELASAVAEGVKAQAAFQITYPTLLKAATGQCAYFHSNSSPAQHSQIGHPLPSPAKQTKTRKKSLLITQPPPAEFFYDDVHPASGPRSSR